VKPQLNKASLQGILKHVSILFILVISLNLVITRSGFADQKQRYVWFEANNSVYLQEYINHVGKWRQVGEPIVTARIHNIESYVKTLNRLNIQVIGGFKTSNVFLDHDYYDETAWKNIADTALRVSNLTNGKPVILENEGAVKALLKQGITSVDYNKLVKVIKKQNWPEIWFWYAPIGSKERVKQLSFNIARAIMQGIPKARLIEDSSAGFSTSSKNSDSLYNLNRTFELDNNPVSIVYLDDQRKKFWKLKNAAKALKQAAGNTVIFYPGFNDIENYQPVINSFIHE